MSDEGEFLGDFDRDGKELLEIYTDDFSTSTQRMAIPSQQLLPMKKKNTRFSDPVTKEVLDQNFLDRIPKKTRSNTKWAYTVWTEWLSYRAMQPETLAEHIHLPSNLSTVPLPELDFWLSRFILEIRRKDGTPYLPNTLMHIASGIQRYMRDELNHQVNIFLKTDPCFDGFRKSIDSRMKELTQDGIGIHVKKKDPVLPEDEKAFWDTGVCDIKTAEGLSNAVFFTTARLLVLEGWTSIEIWRQNSFQFRQIPLQDLDTLCLEAECKKCSRRTKPQKIAPKEIKHYENRENDRCLKIYEAYLSYIPQRGLFYRKPLPPSDKFKHPRFSAAQISEKDMNNMMKKCFKNAGIDITGRNIFNHSGRITCCTTLYNNGFDDKAVSSRSSHRSSAVNAYTRELHLC